MTKRGLRILCYHGFSVSDESQFRPETFMEPRTFQAHINLLVSKKYPVISLEQALRHLDTNSLPSCSVVITFDDGFKTVNRCALPFLRQNGLPSTIFVTTYYCINRNPVFRLVIQYMFWKTSRQEVDLTGMGIPFSGSIPLRPMEARDKITWQLIDYAEKELHEDDRYRIALELGARLNIPYNEIVEKGALCIMNIGEINRISDSGTDIQLHTHRHCFPEDPVLGRREIRDNRSVLEPLLAKELNHFCYPSGLWTENHFSILKHEHVESAVTCDTGLNYADTPRLALKRFLDCQHVSEIEFEAELSGLKEIMRKTRSAIKSLFQKSYRTT
jgi:peptidoglycan/xylan/chitin deacetylase (PgdA/CDA1 family)